MASSEDTATDSRAASGGRAAVSLGNMKVSEQGLALIKAFEGYRPVDRVLVTGTRVAGHGHRVAGDGPLAVSRAEAHRLLLDDLAPFEDMVNENVFSSVTQGQFDALVSLAFNIGPRAFLDSDALRAVNAGRPLDAANAFDQWRRARVAGETFVIDALVRRRTAEKAMFLRPGEGASQPRAPGSDLEPTVDGSVPSELEGPTLGRTEAGRLVGDAPYELARLITDLPGTGRRRDDGPVGELAESVTVVARGAAAEELVDLDIVDGGGADAGPDESAFGELDEVIANDAVPVSPIAEAAEELRGRLDALIDAPETEGEAGEDWPESLIRPAGDELSPEEVEDLFEDPDSRVVAFPARADVPELEGPEVAGEVVGEEPAVAAPVMDTPVTDTPVIDTLVQDEAVRVRALPEAEPEFAGVNGRVERREGGWPFVVLMVLGGGLFGAGAMAWRRGVERVGGLDGELVSVGAMMVGALLLLGGLFYLLKTLLDGEEV